MYIKGHQAQKWAASKRAQCAVNLDRNLKPKLAAPMHFRHRQTDRQMDTDIVA